MGGPGLVTGVGVDDVPLGIGWGVLIDDQVVVIDDLDFWGVLNLIYCHFVYGLITFCISDVKAKSSPPI